MTGFTDPQARERYEREVESLRETAARICRDAREGYEAGTLDREGYERITEMADEYVRGTIRLLKSVYRQP